MAGGAGFETGMGEPAEGDEAVVVAHFPSLVMRNFYRALSSFEAAFGEDVAWVLSGFEREVKREYLWVQPNPTLEQFLCS